LKTYPGSAGKIFRRFIGKGVFYAPDNFPGIGTHFPDIGFYKLSTPSFRHKNLHKTLYNGYNVYNTAYLYYQSTKNIF
jgi:hypothetical protein